MLLHEYKVIKNTLIKVLVVQRVPLRQSSDNRLLLQSHRQLLLEVRNCWFSYEAWVRLFFLILKKAIFGKCKKKKDKWTFLILIVVKIGSRLFNVSNNKDLWLYPKIKTYFEFPSSTSKISFSSPKSTKCYLLLFTVTFVATILVFIRWYNFPWKCEIHFKIPESCKVSSISSDYSFYPVWL